MADEGNVVPLGEKVSNRFNISNGRLYSELRNKSRGKSSNLVFSPFSIAAAIVMLFFGSDGNTHDQIKGFFGGLEPKEAASVVSRILTQQQMEEHAGVVLRAANKVFVENSFPLENDYLQQISKYLKASAENANFRQDPEGELHRINDWVEDQTNNKIRNLLSSGEISTDTVLVLISALYFKAPWLHQFKPHVSDADFQEQSNPTFLGLSSDGVSVQEGIKYMELKKIRNGDFPLNYVESKKGGFPVKVLELPYGGYRQSMVIFMPDSPKDLPKLEEAWNKNPDFLNDLMMEMENNEEFLMDKQITLHLPKFKIGGASIDLEESLKKMGLQNLFSNAADFSKVSSLRVSVDAAVHQAVVDVDEKGTEAAAATAFGISRMAMPITSGTLQIDINKAFLFQIRSREIFVWNKEDMKSRQDDTVLFVGRVADIKSLQS